MNAARNKLASSSCYPRSLDYDRLQYPTYHQLHDQDGPDDLTFDAIIPEEDILPTTTRKQPPQPLQTPAAPTPVPAQQHHIPASSPDRVCSAPNMPFRAENPIVRVDSGSMHTIDTTNVSNLYTLWSAFSKCAEIMEDGKRLEYMTWRLYNLQASCCAPPDHPACLSPPQNQKFASTRTRTSQPLDLPELSSSVESDSSSDAFPSDRTRTQQSLNRPTFQRQDSSHFQRRSNGRHPTPVDLGKIVNSIKEKKELEPLSPLPRQQSQRTQQPQPQPQPQSQTKTKTTSPTAPHTRVEDRTPRPSSPPPSIIPDSSTSTVATAADTEISTISPADGSQASTSTDMSSHSVVRGFSLGRASSSLRSSTKLASPQPAMKPSPVPPKPELPKKKGAMFTLGSESDEGGESSLESHMQHRNSPAIQSSLTEALKRPATNTRKKASFKLGADLSSTRSDEEDPSGGSAIVSDDDDAIEDDDDDAWSSEDEEESRSSSFQQPEYFHRVDSKPNLTSRRSLITTALNEQDRAKQLQNAASRSTPAIRRSRTSSPNGPSLGTSPKQPREVESGIRGAMQIPHKPVIMTTSNTHQPSNLSPRTTRRNMLSTELTESLRKNLLWERQQKNTTSNAALKRRHTSNDVKNLRHYPGEPQPQQPAQPLATIQEGHKGPATFKQSQRPANSYNAFFDNGLQDYHVKGW